MEAKEEPQVEVAEAQLEEIDELLTNEQPEETESIGEKNEEDKEE